MDDSIRFSCSACGKKLKAPATAAGRSAACSCGAKCKVPLPLPPDAAVPLVALKPTAKPPAPDRPVYSLLPAVETSASAPVVALLAAHVPPRNLVPSPDEILEVFQPYKSVTGLYLRPDIPAKKAANARESCQMPSKEELLALIDCTVFGSAKHCLAFGHRSLFFHNDWAGNTPGRGTVPYTDFDGRLFRKEGAHEIHLGPKQCVNFAGASCPKDRAVTMLQDLQRLITGRDLDAAPLRAAGPVEILHVLTAYAGIDGFHVSPNIPTKKAEIALESCQMPRDEELLGLIDCTVFKTAKHCLAFGTQGVYFHNDWSGTTPGSGAVAYADFGQREFRKEGWHEVHLGPGQFVNFAGATCSKDKAVAMLQDLQRLFTGRVIGASLVAADKKPVSGTPIPGMKCPVCQQEHVVSWERSVAARMGAGIGAVLLGAATAAVTGSDLLGNAVGVGAWNQGTSAASGYKCQACNHLWQGAPP